MLLRFTDLSLYEAVTAAAATAAGVAAEMTTKITGTK